MVPHTQPSAASTTQALKQKALGALAELPPFPAMLTRLIASLTAEDVSFSKLGADWWTVKDSAGQSFAVHTQPGHESLYQLPENSR